MLLEGKEIPQHLLQDSFDDLGALIWFWYSYCDLQTCRPTGNGPASIPWTAIYMYANDFLMLNRDDVAEFVFFIRSLDTTWLEWATEKLKKESDTRKLEQNKQRQKGV